MKILGVMLLAAPCVVVAPAFAQTAGNTSNTGPQGSGNFVAGQPPPEATIGFVAGKPAGEGTGFVKGKGENTSDTDSYADLVASVMPSVVNITVKGMGEKVKIGDGDYARYLTELVGSGSIIDSTGIIATNKHVVNNAYEITVILHDGGSYRAQLLGMGAGNDLALLKIDAGRPLPPAKIGNSDELRVGDRVMAIGNPHGLNSSVSTGIVSGLHRRLTSGILMQNALGEFIQTDASINHGNSGGPLFNMKGEVIGVDNQIYSDTKGGGSIGIGFAIPSNDAQLLVQQVHKYGDVRLGWLGMRLQTITSSMAEALSLPKSTGAIVAALAPSGPGAEAGLKAGDIIQTFDGQEVTDSRSLDRGVVLLIGKTVQLGVWRDGSIQTVPVTVKEYPQDIWVSHNNEDVKDIVFTKISDAGILVSDLTDELRAQFGLDASVTGPVVTEVAANTAASAAGIRPGDLVQKVQDDDVRSRAEMQARLKEVSAKGLRNAALLIGMGQNARWVTLPLRL
jgi:serine protease Do